MHKIKSKLNPNELTSLNKQSKLQVEELIIPIVIPSLLSTNSTDVNTDSKIRSSNSVSLSPSNSSSISTTTFSSTPVLNAKIKNQKINDIQNYSSSSSSGIESGKSSSSSSSSNANDEDIASLNRSNIRSNSFIIQLEKLMNSKLKLKIEEQNLDEFYLKSSTDVMIYLNLKETNLNMDFRTGFEEFLVKHYHEISLKFAEQKYAEPIRQFNFYRNSILKNVHEPNTISVYRLYEYYNSLYAIEKRFFQDSQCEHVFFTWYDSISGIESTQKSIQYEKACVLFNCAALYTQMAGICCDGKENRVEEQMIYWQKAAGCLNYSLKNYSNSPTLDMSSYCMKFFIELFMCQAYEAKCKLLFANVLNNKKFDFYDSKSLFNIYVNCSKIFSHVRFTFYSFVLRYLSRSVINKNL